MKYSISETDNLQYRLEIRLGCQLPDRSYKQLRNRLGHGLINQLWDRLWSQLWDRLMDRLRRRLWNRLWNRLERYEV
jgi:hypothetical protein